MIVGVEFNASDQAEAGRRVEDIRDALQARFAGVEIYAPSTRKRGNRLAGSPHFRHFLTAIGRPALVDPFDDQATELIARDKAAQEPMLSEFDDGGRQAKIEEAAKHLLSIISQGTQSGWIPSQGPIAEAALGLQGLIYPNTRANEDRR